MHKILLQNFVIASFNHKRNVVKLLNRNHITDAFEMSTFRPKKEASSGKISKRALGFRVNEVLLYIVSG